MRARLIIIIMWKLFGPLNILLHFACWIQTSLWKNIGPFIHLAINIVALDIYQKNIQYQYSWCIGIMLVSNSGALGSIPRQRNDFLSAHLVSDVSCLMFICTSWRCFIHSTHYQREFMRPNLKMTLNSAYLIRSPKPKIAGSSPPVGLNCFLLHILP